MDDVDLVAQPDSRSTTFAGGSCTAGEVQAWMYAEDLDLVWGEGDASRSGSGRIVSPTGLTVSPRGSAPFGAPGAARVLGSEPVDLVITPKADGSWSSTDDTAYDHALVGGFAVCGDPLADGFIYDDQAVEVQVEPVDTTTSTAVPTTAPAPAPANAVAGTPTYAG